MNIKSLVFAGSALAAVTVSAVQVSDVTARQRWPWNNLVDVEFTVSDAADGEAYCVDLSAQYRGGDAKVSAVTLLSEPVVGAGTHRLTWDFGKDCPNFKADDMQMIVSVYPFSDATPVYLVIDVSGGESATKYPVRYTTVAPVHTAGAADPCKTTEIWMKRVKHGTIQMGGTYNSFPRHTCVLTNDFYLGVFALTQAQYDNVAKSTGVHSFFTNAQCRATRPADTIKNSSIRGSSDYPEDVTIPSSANTFLSRIQAKSGLAIDLPTEWQWEYACRAGLSGSRYPGAEYRHKGNALPEGGTTDAPDGEWTAEFGTAYVDQYAPNGWGFYGMYGNVWEWCVNRNLTFEMDAVLVEPMGGPSVGVSAAEKRSFVMRGGGWKSGKDYCSNNERTNQDPWNINVNNPKMASNYGARLCLTVKGAAAGN